MFHYSLNLNNQPTGTVIKNECIQFFIFNFSVFGFVEKKKEF